MQLPSALTDLIEQLKRLPGVGPRSAERLTYFLLRMPAEDVVRLADSLRAVTTQIQTCKQCFNVAEGDLCLICQDTRRDSRVLLLVEEPLDVMAVEKTGRFNGVYHVLGGVIDPIRGIGAEELRVRELLERVDGLLVDLAAFELIIATNPSTEGETTAIYLRRIFDQRWGERVKISRIARGLPVGGDLEFADPITLSRALEGRLPY